MKTAAMANEIKRGRFKFANDIGLRRLGIKKSDYHTEGNALSVNSNHSNEKINLVGDKFQVKGSSSKEATAIFAKTTLFVDFFRIFPKILR